MKLTPGEVREILGLSQDTFRHWKTALPPLAGRNGYKPCFSLGDLFAMALVKAMTDEASIAARALHAISAKLFQQCDNRSWAGFERSALLVELAHVRVEFVPESQIPRLNGIGIVVPCRPIITELRERLLMEKEESDQGNLRLPPTIVPTETLR